MSASILVALLLPLPSLADPKISAYEELCQYDTLCSRVKNDDGSIMKPKPAITKLIETMADPIHEYAKLYEVDPRAVAGAIMAENTMNVQIDDEIQNWIVKNNIWGSQALLNAGMSVGPGQINTEPAMAADKYIAELGFRPPRSQEEIQKRLLTPAGAAEYSAAIIRQAQDAYKDEGLDISGDPAVLSSLYNMGQRNKPFKERAQETKKSKSRPKPNFFGFFVGQNISAVEEAIGWSPSRGMFRVAKKEYETPGSLAALSEEITLAAAPPKCSARGAGKSGELQARQSWESYPSFSSGKSKFAEVTGRSVDCQMREWLQVRTGFGEIGWVPKSDLQSAAVSADHWRLTHACEAASESCVQEAVKQYGEGFPASPAKDGKYMVSVRRKDINDPVSTKSGGEFYCEPYDQMKKRLISSAANSGNTGGSGGWPTSVAPVPGQSMVGGFGGVGMNMQPPTPLTATELKEIRTLAQAKQKEVRKALGIDPDTGGSGWGGGGGWVDSFLPNLDYCLENPEFDCTLHDKDTVTKALKTKLSSYRSMSELKNAVHNFMVRLDMTPADPKVAASRITDEVKKARAEKHLEFLAAFSQAQSSCDEIRNYYPGLHRTISELLRDGAQAYDPKPESRNANEQLKSYAGILRNYCDQAWFASSYRDTGRFPDGSQELSCEFSNSSFSGGIFGYSMDILKNLDITEDEQLSLVQYYLDDMKYMISRAKNPSTNQQGGVGQADDPEARKKELAFCNYDPLETSKAIENLSQNKCVATILVPDMNLTKGQTVVPLAHIVLDTQLADGKIAVIFKHNCRTDLLPKPRLMRSLPFGTGEKE